MNFKLFPKHRYKESQNPTSKTVQFDPYRSEYADDRPISKRCIDRLKEFGYLVKKFAKLV